jgi:hypothetical protein
LTLPFTHPALMLDGRSAFWLHCKHQIFPGRRTGKFCARRFPVR